MGLNTEHPTYESTVKKNVFFLYSSGPKLRNILCAENKTKPKDNIQTEIFVQF